MTTKQNLCFIFQIYFIYRSHTFYVWHILQQIHHYLLYVILAPYSVEGTVSEVFKFLFLERYTSNMENSIDNFYSKLNSKKSKKMSRRSWTIYVDKRSNFRHPNIHALATNSYNIFLLDQIEFFQFEYFLPLCTMILLEYSFFFVAVETTIELRTDYSHLK